MQHFAAQRQPFQQATHSLRASQYERAKRKRDEDDEDATDADDAADITSKSFPHAPVRTPALSISDTQVQKSLAELDPPLFAVNATSKSLSISRASEGSAVRETHLGILTTLMHRCLLEGDFPRAGRAWGLILRTHVAGTSIDPRNHKRWGIGAELLLHQRTGDPFSGSQNRQGPFQDEQAAKVEDSFYTEEGFELAREYYERLIVQHPNRKYILNVTDDLTFYPAMFSLWIYETCEKSRRARKQQEDLSRMPNEDTTMLSEDPSTDASVIAAQELQHARQIASRMDQLIVSPPFDKHGDLLELRGMVGLWLADLILGKEAGGDEWGQINEDESEMMESSSEKLQKYTESRRELKGAQDSFARALANGRKLGGVVGSINAKIDDVTKKIADIGAG